MVFLSGSKMCFLSMIFLPRRGHTSLQRYLSHRRPPVSGCCVRQAPSFLARPSPPSSLTLNQDLLVTPIISTTRLGAQVAGQRLLSPQGCVHWHLGHRRLDRPFARRPFAVLLALKQPSV